MKKLIPVIALTLVTFLSFGQAPGNSSFKVKPAPGSGNAQYILTYCGGTGLASFDFTIETWIKIPSGSTGTKMIIDAAGNNSFNGGYLFLVNSANKLQGTILGQSSTYLTAYGNTAIPYDTWTHVAMSHDGLGHIKLYINGVADGNVQQNFNHFNNIANAYIGCLYVNQFVSGPFELDEFRFWIGERTATELLDNKDICLTANEPNLELYYNFEGCTPTVVFDAEYQVGGSGTPNSGAITSNSTDIYDFGAICCGTVEAYTLSSGTVTIDNSEATAYQWLDCDNGDAPINGETSISFTPSIAGNYACEVTNGPGCSSTSTCVYVDPATANSANHALKFNGIDQKIIASNNVEFGSEMTFEGWIYPKAQYYKRIFTKYSGTGSTIGTIILDTYDATSNNGRNLRLVIAYPSGAQFTTATNILTLNEWQHVACTYNNGEVKFYIDGVLEHSATLNAEPIPGLNVTPIIGADHGTNDAELFDGYMDDVRLWTRSRSQSQIADSMSMCLQGSENNLAVYYNMENISALTVNDETSNANNGTLGTTAVFVDSPVACASVTAEIDENSSFDFNIYPNPATTFVKIISNGTVENVVVRSLTGQIITQSQQYSFSIAQLPCGVYLVTVQSNIGLFTKRLIKE